MEHVVRMGELAVSRAGGHVLSCIGLGSCIGVVLFDRGMGAAALAHVMLPSGAASDATPAKYADSGVPATVRALAAAGARPTRLEAALVGGASMFAMAGGQEIGARNEDAVRATLDDLRIPVVAVATGGSSGRTVRVHVASPGLAPRVTVRDAGGADEDLDLDVVLAAAA
ncbi:MAG TPA: chemotaxis protein CheD [Baekduia sp.]|nr:chemotaxis protein CheD [Baekduia sp.]